MSEEPIIFNPNKRYKRGHCVKLIALSAIVISVFVFVSGLDRMINNHDSATSLDFKIFSHNIRYDNQHNIGGTEKPWSERKYEVYKAIKFNTFSTKTIITLQEVLKNQLDDLLELLNEQDQDQSQDQGWTYYGVGRNDGKEAGEYAPILFNTRDFKLIDSSVFWLSETPDIPSRGWDADQERIVTWARLQSARTTINVFNTHLDHIGVRAREESVKLIANKTKTYNNDISFITGDFNSEPDEEAYQTLQKVFKDSRLYNKNQYGHTNTFTGFNPEDTHKVIDYVFFDPRLDKVEGFAVLGNFHNGMFSSDHRPVVVEISL